MNRSRYSLRLLTNSTAAAVILTMATGCAQIKRSVPTMERVIDVTKVVIREPETWVPLSAAAVIAATNLDREISDWASEETPLFGSQQSADDASDDLRNLLVIGAAAATLLAPVPEGDDGFRSRRIIANVASGSAVGAVVEAGKMAVGRDRPNDRNDESFPSGHSGTAFSSAVYIEQGLNETIENPLLRKSIKIGTTSAASLVAWARVEAQEHFPVDVLVSAGISNLIAKVFYQSITSDGESDVPPVAFEAGRDGFLVRFEQSF